jgi:hypothetical protein
VHAMLVLGIIAMVYHALRCVWMLENLHEIELKKEFQI